MLHSRAVLPQFLCPCKQICLWMLGLYLVLVIGNESQLKKKITLTSAEAISQRDQLCLRNKREAPHFSLTFLLDKQVSLHCVWTDALVFVWVFLHLLHQTLHLWTRALKPVPRLKDHKDNLRRRMIGQCLWKLATYCKKKFYTAKFLHVLVLVAVYDFVRNKASISVRVCCKK